MHCRAYTDPEVGSSTRVTTVCGTGMALDCNAHVTRQGEPGDLLDVVIEQATNAASFWYVHAHRVLMIILLLCRRVLVQSNRWCIFGVQMEPVCDCACAMVEEFCAMQESQRNPQMLSRRQTWTMDM